VLTRLQTTRTGIITCAVATLLGLLATGANAQTGSGGQAASFLKVPVGARLMASPDVVAGMRPDASAMYSNPAFMASLESAGLFASSSRWLDHLSFSAMGAAIPLGRNGTVLGVGASLMYSSGLKGYDDALNLVGEESVYDLGLDLSIAHRFGSSGLSIGAGATYIRQHVMPADGAGFAFHLGASYWRGRNMFHAAARDLAGTVTFDDGAWPVDSELLAGAGRVFDSGLGQFFAGMQATSSPAYGTRLRIGIDFLLNGMFTLRTGINEDLDAPQTGSPFNAGFGMCYGSFAVEYAYTPQEYFSGAHTFSLGYNFGAHRVSAQPRALVPAGDLAPDILDTPSSASDHADETARPATYLLVGGAHGSLDSARSETRALELLKIPATVESEGPRYRVVIGRFATFNEASRARTTYRGKGHEFQILAR